MRLPEILTMTSSSVRIRLDLSRHLCWGIAKIWACEHQVLPMPWLYGFGPNMDENIVPRGEEISLGREHASGASFTFLSTHMGLPVQGMLSTHTMSTYQMTPLGCTHVSIEEYNKVSQLFEAERLKLAVATLSDEHILELALHREVGVGMFIEEELAAASSAVTDRL
ncbi:hypothetical protein JCGZ_26641 [Jatropha curcas]|uniref:Uncharacterized protein n=1 Tax=Jatropha curcas TaxID=180498 RepID=A0A067JJV6_JATCU|nr:hypothetical protein JCGZ_26641 [Jatropha curcas]